MRDNRNDICGRLWVFGNEAFWVVANKGEALCGNETLNQLWVFRDEIGIETEASLRWDFGHRMATNRIGSRSGLKF